MTSKARAAAQSTVRKAQEAAMQSVSAAQKMAEENFEALWAKWGSHLPAPMRERAEQIWAAGLSAFAKAQSEGGKVRERFEGMVQEGLALQQKTQGMAEERWLQAQSRVSDMAKELTSSATQQWGKLEGIFEERVAKSLEKLGVPTARDVNELMTRIEELNQLVLQLTAAMTGQPVSTKAAAKPSSKASAKTTAKAAAKPATKAAKKPAAKVSKKAASTAAA